MHHTAFPLLTNVIAILSLGWSDSDFYTWYHLALTWSSPQFNWPDRLRLNWSRDARLTLTYWLVIYKSKGYFSFITDLDLCLSRCRGEEGRLSHQHLKQDHSHAPPITQLGVTCTQGHKYSSESALIFETNRPHNSVLKANTHIFYCVDSTLQHAVQPFFMYQTNGNCPFITLPFAIKSLCNFSYCGIYIQVFISTFVLRVCM